MGRKRKNDHHLDPTLSHGIIAVILTILAILIVLSFFGNAGTLGIVLDDYILSSLFGSVRYISPIIVLVLAWFLIKDVEYDYRPTHVLGAILLFIAASSAIHMQFDPADMWREALNGNGGGMVGMPAWVLQTYVGFIGGVVILIGCIIVALLLMFNTALAHFVVLHRKLLLSFGFLGRAFVSTVSTLFVRDGGQSSDEYDDEDEAYDDEEYDEDEEDDEEDEPIFTSRSMEGEDEEEEEDEEEDEELEEADIAAIPRQPAPKQPKNDSVWDQKVVIKEIPPLSLLSSKAGKPTSGDLKANAKIIKDTLKEFRIAVTMGDVRVGPTVTQYTLKPAKGVKLSRITALSNDLALALAAASIRIEAPIPGKSLVGIEIPNEKTALVALREMLGGKVFNDRKHNMMMALGKDVAGKSWFADLPSMPHLLIAGATGSGKTICMHTIIASLLYQNTAETLRMIMVDPKRVELTLYNGIPHLLTPVITNTSKTINALKWTIGEMDRRFELLSKAGNRDIVSYNKRNPKTKLPYIVFFIDELADLMATAAGDVEAGIIRLAQLARAVGIHLVVATQRPSVDVITGLMKANIPGRISFSVASLTDSRTILDTGGAEKLLGRGDMLYLSPAYSKPLRIQGAFISEEETKALVNYLHTDEEDIYDESITGGQSGGTLNMFGGPSDDKDALFADAQREVIAAGKASASFLQRRLKVGYARAARILDELEQAGIIGPSNGSKPRDILMTETEASATIDAGPVNVYKGINDGKDEKEEDEDGEEEEYDAPEDEELESEELEDDMEDEEEYEDDDDTEEEYDEDEEEEDDEYDEDEDDEYDDEEEEYEDEDEYDEEDDEDEDDDPYEPDDEFDDDDYEEEEEYDEDEEEPSSNKFFR